MAEPVLELDALVERRTVAIKLSTGRQEFELRNSGEFSILEFHRLGTWGARIDELSAQVDGLAKVAGGEIPEQLITELSSLLDQFCRLILMAPDAVHLVLSDTHRLRITKAFTELPGGPPAQTGERAEAAPARSTGESSSPD
jgi:hypothetical protein